MIDPFDVLMKRLKAGMQVPNLEIPACGVKIFRKDDRVPDSVSRYQPDQMTITSCHAIRAAMLDDAVYLTETSIGCIAGAISLGLVEKEQKTPLAGSRVYTEIMRRSSGKGEAFVPPAPSDFTDGTVYACKDAGIDDFSLFGKEDSGRFKKREIASAAISEMPAIQPPTTQGIFYFSPAFADIRIVPDVVILSLRPVELCRVLQGYQYETGKRVKADIGSLRAGCSDLIAYPYLSGEINFSPYCLGARLIARFEGDRMGLSLPYPLFQLMVKGVEESTTGFPFQEYPGAVP
jgi:uncharacterized protein (DUF169 family)